MTALSIIYTLLFYVAIIVLVAGLTLKIRQYMKVPAPLKVPVTPAPITQGGVVYRMLIEVVFFNSLFRSSKWTWIFGWIFHVSLLLAFFRHLRYVVGPDTWLWALVNLELVQSAGKYAGFAMVVGLVGLFGRRIFVDRVRYISSPSDYLMLILLAAIAVSGLLMSFVNHVDIVSLKAFIMGLFLFDWQNMPSDPILLVHITLVLLLAVITPISKLLHAPGLFFAPTRNQADNPREVRHLSPWGAELEARDGRNN